MTHADAVRKAKERVVLEVGKAYGRHGLEDTASIEYAYGKYEALAAQTCGTCGGTGRLPGHGEGCFPQYEQCSGCKRCACDNGKRPAALSPSSDGSKEADRD